MFYRLDVNQTDRNLLKEAWDKVTILPGGKRLMSRFIGVTAPYTGTIHAQVVELRHGYARAELQERWRVRNHLRSVHAMALCNLAELCSGAAFVYSLPDDARGILKGFSIQYLKKARGRLTAECIISDPPVTSEKAEFEVEVITRDEAGDIVTRAQAQWVVGPKRKR